MIADLPTPPSPLSTMQGVPDASCSRICATASAVNGLVSSVSVKGSHPRSWAASGSLKVRVPGSGVRTAYSAGYDDNGAEHNHCYLALRGLLPCRRLELHDQLGRYPSAVLDFDTLRLRSLTNCRGSGPSTVRCWQCAVNQAARQDGHVTAPGSRTGTEFALSRRAERSGSCHVETTRQGRETSDPVPR